MRVPPLPAIRNLPLSTHPSPRAVRAECLVKLAALAHFADDGALCALLESYAGGCIGLIAHSIHPAHNSQWVG